MSTFDKVLPTVFGNRHPRGWNVTNEVFCAISRYNCIINQRDLDSLMTELTEKRYAKLNTLSFDNR